MKVRRPPGLVLVYHRVTEIPLDPLGLCIRPDVFIAQMEALVRLADVVPLGEIRGGRRGGRRRAALTFDDGYADSAEVVAPILGRLGLPATFFLITGESASPSELWWDRLGHVILDAPDDAGTPVVDVGGKALRLDLRTPAGRARGFTALRRRLRGLAPEQIDADVTAIASAVGSSDGACEHHRRVTPDQVSALLDVGEVGAHTRRHPLLSILDVESAREEIVGSKSDAERLAGSAIRSFSYPYGMEGSFSAASDLVREAGFEMACINLPGIVRRRTDSFAIPRAPAGTCDAESFAPRVAGWFDGNER